MVDLMKCFVENLKTAKNSLKDALKGYLVEKNLKNVQWHKKLSNAGSNSNVADHEIDLPTLSEKLKIADDPLKKTVINLWKHTHHWVSRYSLRKELKGEKICSHPEWREIHS